MPCIGKVVDLQSRLLAHVGQDLAAYDSMNEHTEQNMHRLSTYTYVIYVTGREGQEHKSFAGTCLVAAKQILLIVQ